MKKGNLVILGAGGHAKVVLDAVLKQGVYHVLGFLDEHKPVKTIVLPGYEVLGSPDLIEKLSTDVRFFIVAVGNNEVRKRLFESLKRAYEPARIVHPAASVADSAELGAGTVVLANAVVNASSVIGENCIINSMALVDHETRVGSHSHIAQGALIGSNLKLPELFFAKMGECVPSVSHL